MYVRTVRTALPYRFFRHILAVVKEPSIATAALAKKILRSLADPAKAAFFPSFFKTGKGQYGEGDVFIGVTVPLNRSVAKRCNNMPLTEIEKLLDDPIHECRFLALEILVLQYEKGDEEARAKIFRFYRDHLKQVNNWDLVDTSAPYIAGPYLDETNGAGTLDRLAKSTHLWTQRVAIVATYHFIRRGELAHTFRIADLLMDHPHDLIHKAVGWMLREAGKKDEAALKKYLKTRCKTMPRTMLRYSIERFSPDERKRYLSGVL